MGVSNATHQETGTTIAGEGRVAIAKPSPGESSDVIENPIIDDWLGRNLRLATNVVLQNFVDRFAPLQFRPSLFTLINLIEQHPGSSGSRLSEWMLIPRANMVLLLRELEQRGLIERVPDPANRRAHVVTLSAAGRALMPELHAAHNRHIEHLDSLMSPAERTFLLTLLQRIWKRGISAESAVSREAFE